MLKEHISFKLREVLAKKREKPAWKTVNQMRDRKGDSAWGSLYASSSSGG